MECTAGQHLEPVRGHPMSCLREQVTPTCPPSPANPDLWSNSDSFSATHHEPGDVASRDFWESGFALLPVWTRTFLLQLFPLPSWLFRGLSLSGTAPLHPCVPQILRASNWPAVFSPPCLYKQEAETKTTVPSPSASTQALGRIGSVHPVGKATPW